MSWEKIATGGADGEKKVGQAAEEMSTCQPPPSTHWTDQHWQSPWHPSTHCGDRSRLRAPRLNSPRAALARLVKPHLESCVPSANGVAMEQVAIGNAAAVDKGPVMAL